MTQRAALTELIAKIEAGDLWPDGADIAPPDALRILEKCFPGDEATQALVEFAYDGSTTDAIRLTLALLPGAWLALSGSFPTGWSAVIYTSSVHRVPKSATHPTYPARALLIAGLRAHRNTLQEEGE